MDYSAALKDYTPFDFNDGRWARQVFRRGTGPGVIVIHEMPGLHPFVIRFADRVAAAGTGSVGDHRCEGDVTSMLSRCSVPAKRA